MARTASTHAAEIHQLRPRTAGPVPAPDVLDKDALASSHARHNCVDQAVRRHIGLVWRILRRSGLGAADADDATQDVFWVFSQRCAEVADGATRAFLVSTALRVASDRKKSKWSRSATELADSDLSVEGQSLPDEQLQMRRQTQLLDRLLSELLPEEREIFILSEVEEMTRKEVAAVLGIPEGTAASRLRRARESFERLLRSSLARRGQANV